MTGLVQLVAGAGVAVMLVTGLPAMSVAQAAHGPARAAGAARADDWPSFGYGPGSDRDNPRETTLTVGSVHRLRLQWAYTSLRGNLASESEVGPSVAGGKVYQQVFLQGGSHDGGDLEAIGASSGKLEWQQEDAEGNQAVVDGLVIGPYASAADGALEARHANGSLAWTYTVPGIDSTPLVSNGIVYVTAYYGGAFAYALNVRTGALVWKIPGPAVGFGGLAADGRTVYLSSSDGVEAVGAATGKFHWMTTGIGDESVAVSGGHVFSVSPQTISELNPRTGSTLWSVSGPGAPFWADNAPAVDAHAIYVTNQGGSLYAYNIKNGALLWSHDPGATDSSPAVADGVVYTGTGGGVMAVNAATGSVLWRAHTGHIMDSPAIANGHLYIVSAKGIIYSYGL